MKPHQGRHRERMAAGTPLRQIGPSLREPMFFGFGKLQGALSPIPINFANKTEILAFFSDIMISVS